MTGWGTNRSLTETAPPAHAARRGAGACVTSLFAAGLVLAFVSGTPALATSGDKVTGSDNSTTPSHKVRPELKKPIRGTRIHVEASHITYDARTHVAVATGRVIIVYGRYVLVASKVVYDQKNDRMQANGEVRLREPGGNVLTAETADLQNKFRDGFATHLRLLLTNDATITAEYAKRRDGYLTVFDHVTYTRCKSCVTTTGAPLWEIRSAEVTYDEKKHTIYHRDATFEFLGLPVFWTPYLSHPDPTVKRRTGFLIPSYSYSSAFGFGAEIPYFIDLAPNYDLTLRPVITSRQGPLARAIWRHRTLDGEYSIDAAGIYQLDTNLPPPGDRRFRGFVRSIGRFRINNQWTWGWDGTATTDETFMRRYKLDGRTEIDNSIYLTGMKDRNYFKAELLQYEGLLATDNNNQFPIVLPHVSYSYTFDQPVLGGELGLSADIYSLFRNDAVFSPFSTLNLGTEQSQAIANLHWQRRMVSTIGLVVTPFADLRGDLFVTQGLPDPTVPGGVRGTDTTARVLPTVGLDARYPLVRSDSWGTSVLTPVAQIISAPDATAINKIANEDATSLNFDTTSLFLDDKFTGYDQFESGTRANVGLLYNLILPAGGFVRTAFGESLHLAGQNAFVGGSGLDKTRSDYVAAVAYQPTDNLRFYWQGRFNHATLAMNSMETGLNFDYGPLTLGADYVKLDAEPAYGRPLPQEQVWATADLALGNGGWKMFGGLRYDLALDKPVKQLIGFGYDCDCFSFKIYYKENFAHDRDIKVDRALMLSIEFKTLGSTTVGSGL